MLSRRELMRNGLLLSTVGSLAPRLTTARQTPAKVWVVEDQIPATSDIIAATASSAAEVLRFTADPGPLWMHRLEPRLKHGPFAIGGCTSASVLFCLQYLARDYGLALVELGAGTNLPVAVERDADALVDLRDPRLADQRAACTWLMLPRRV